jgi:hypothetical protein
MRAHDPGKVSARYLAKEVAQMSSITTITKTDSTPSGFGMPVYGCALPQAVKGAPIAAARVRQMGGAVLAVSGVTAPGLRAWSPPIS